MARPEGREQRDFGARGRLRLAHRRRERAEARRQSPLVRETRRAGRALLFVGRGFVTRTRVQERGAREAVHVATELLAVHAKHLAACNTPACASPPSAPDSASPPAAAARDPSRPRIFSASIARARCRRDLTVPTAQPRATAASA